MRISIVSFFFAFLLLFQVWFPTFSYALTGGPTQPEFSSFSQIGSGNMVDLFTGNFQYEIPLFEVEGHMVALNYNSDAGMEEEASWVGLGWTLNPGSINRDVRGVPDDFNGEEIVKEYNYKGETTFGADVGANLEVFGKTNLGYRTGVFYNTRKGPGLEQKFSAAVGYGSFNLGANLSYNTQEGIDLGMGLSGGVGMEKNELSVNHFANLSSSMNSRSGLNTLLLNGSTNTNINLALNSAYSFLSPTHFPTNNLPIQNTGFTFVGKLGLEVYGIMGNLEISGYYQKQDLLNNQSVQEAFGYLHLDNTNNQVDAIQDANVNNHYIYRKNLPNLPISYGTPDLFNVSGFGMAGQFSAKRMDRGIFGPTRSRSISSSASVGTEIAGGLLAHVGFNVAVSSGTSEQQKWKDNNMLSGIHQFTTSKNEYESYVFRDQTEIGVDIENYFEITGEENPLRSKLRKRAGVINAERTFIKGRNFGNDVEMPLSSSLFQSSQRLPRKKTFSFLTGKEASVLGLDRKITSYNYGVSQQTSSFSASFPSFYKNDISRLENNGGDHISEITITGENGTRYVYGIPAYNTHRKEYSFSVNGNRSSGKHVGYNPSDASINNSLGENNFFESKEIPPYAHSYLLTAILPPEYQDKPPVGISYNDPGNPIKFRYHKVEYENAELYKWRIPTAPDSAFYQQAFHSTDKNDIGHFTYGEKEIWYLNTIETKTELIVFHISNREDALGVDGPHGEISNEFKLKKLDSIQIYAKNNIAESTYHLHPKKTIHFDYNYELCKGVPNHMNPGEGKLTLKKVWFTHRGNSRGELNPYEFEYYKSSEAEEPFDYNPNLTDRWGMYKPQLGNLPDNQIFPYSIQDEEISNDYSAAWNLNRISLPSGAIISVEYESDSYAFVQDKRAGQMFPIAGFLRHHEDVNFTNNLYAASNKTPSKYIGVEISSAITSKSEAVEKYLQDVKELYFKAKVDLNSANKWEYIHGYMEYEKDDVIIKDINNINYLLIPIKVTTIKNQNFHPISLAALQFTRMSLPEVAYPDIHFIHGSDVSIDVFSGLISEIKNLVSGFERSKLNDNWAKNVNTENHSSWIRLANQNYNKYGGGSRVKSIQMSDAWDAWPGVDPKVYGQKYTYTKPYQLHSGELIEISSGVASYEPLIGGEENLFRNPMPYEDIVKLGSNSLLYTETPIGESLYPSPQVGYSKIRVESIIPANEGISGIGYTEYEFYTAKDFPVREDLTQLKDQTIRTNPILRLLNFTDSYNIGLSQGISIEVNDMHGKPKKTTQYNDWGIPISFEQYNYFTNEVDGKVILSNNIPVVNIDGSISIENLGLDVRSWNFMSQETKSQKNYGVDPNLDVIPLGFFPVPIPIVVPWIKIQKSNFSLKAAQNTKFIQRKGILKEIITMKEGSTISRENVAFDKYSGQTIVVKTQNNFNNPIYEVSYPAYWMYENMGPSFKNIGADFKSIEVSSSGQINNFISQTDFFHPGDELLIWDKNIAEFSLKKYFVVSMNDESTFRIMDSNGDLLNEGLYDIKIIRSGYRNLLNQSSASITMMDCPVSATHVTIAPETRVLNYTASEFNDLWKIHCDVIDSIGEPGTGVFTPQKFNPFFEGMKGRPMLSATHSFVGQRTPVGLNIESRLENDGYLDSFDPFWYFENDEWKFNKESWHPTIQNLKYDLNSNIIEYENSLGIKNSMLYDIQFLHPLAVAENCSFNQFAYDGFHSKAFMKPFHFESLLLYPFSIPPIQGFDATQFGVSHSGWNSHAYNKDHSLFKPWEVTFNIGSNCNSPDSNLVYYNIIDSTYFESTCNACLQGFKPLRDSTYFFSAWLASDSSGFGECLDSLGLIFEFGNWINNGSTNEFVVSHSVDFNPNGPLIDQWKKIQGEIKIPNDYYLNQMRIRMKTKPGFEKIYLDDFRIYPHNSTFIAAYNYDPVSLNLITVLDENNFATYYEYAEDGSLIRIKRETEKGIMTLQEQSKNLKMK